MQHRRSQTKKGNASSASAASSSQPPLQPPLPDVTAATHILENVQATHSSEPSNQHHQTKAAPNKNTNAKSTRGGKRSQAINNSTKVAPSSSSQSTAAVVPLPASNSYLSSTVPVIDVDQDDDDDDDDVDGVSASTTVGTSLTPSASTMASVGGSSSVLLHEQPSPSSSSVAPTVVVSSSRTPLWDAFSSTLLGVPLPLSNYAPPPPSTTTPIITTTSAISEPEEARGSSSCGVLASAGDEEAYVRRVEESARVYLNVLDALKGDPVNRSICVNAHAALLVAGRQGDHRPEAHLTLCALQFQLASSSGATMLCNDDAEVDVQSDSAGSPTGRKISNLMDTTTPSTLLKALSMHPEGGDSELPDDNAADMCSSPQRVPVLVSQSPHLLASLEALMAEWLHACVTSTPEYNNKKPTEIIRSQVLDAIKSQVTLFLIHSKEHNDISDGVDSSSRLCIASLYKVVEIILDKVLLELPSQMTYDSQMAEEAEDPEVEESSTATTSASHTNASHQERTDAALRQSLEYTYRTFLEKPGMRPYSSSQASRTGMSLPVLTPSDFFHTYVGRQQQQQQARFLTAVVGNLTIPILQHLLVPRLSELLAEATKAAPQLWHSHIVDHLSALCGENHTNASTTAASPPPPTQQLDLWVRAITTAVPSLSTIYHPHPSEEQAPPTPLCLSNAILRVLSNGALPSSKEGQSVYPTIRLHLNDVPPHQMLPIPGPRVHNAEESTIVDILNQFDGMVGPSAAQYRDQLRAHASHDNCSPLNVFEDLRSWEPRRVTCLEAPTKDWLASCYSHNDLRAGMECAVVSPLDGDDILIPSMESLLRKEAAILDLHIVAEALVTVNANRERYLQGEGRCGGHAAAYSATNKENIPPLVGEEKLLKAKLGMQQHHADPVTASASSSSSRLTRSPAAACASMQLAGHSFEENVRWPCLASTSSVKVRWGPPPRRPSPLLLPSDVKNILSCFYSTSPVQLLLTSSSSADTQSPSSSPSSPIRGVVLYVDPPAFTCSNYTAVTFLPPPTSSAHNDSTIGNTRPRPPSSPLISSLPIQAEIKGFMRTTLMDWFVDVGVRYNFNPDTVFIASSIFDRFMGVLLDVVYGSGGMEQEEEPSVVGMDGLFKATVSSSAPPVPRVPLPQHLIERYTCPPSSNSSKKGGAASSSHLPYDLQLIGAAALFIAAKTEEIYPPTAGEVSYITADAFSKDQILAMEQHMLSTMGFDVVSPTLPVFTQGFQVFRSACLRNQRQHQQKGISLLTSEKEIGAKEKGEEMATRPSQSQRPHDDTFERSHLVCCMPELRFRGMIDAMKTPSASLINQPRRPEEVLHIQPKCFGAGGRAGPVPEAITHLEHSLTSYLSHIVMLYGPYGCGVPVSTMSTAINYVSRMWAAEVFYRPDDEQRGVSQRHRGRPSAPVASLYDLFVAKAAEAYAADTKAASSSSSAPSSPLGAQTSSQQVMGRRRVVRDASSPDRTPTATNPSKDQSMRIVRQMEYMGYLPPNTVPTPSSPPSCVPLPPSALLDACAILVHYLTEERAHTAQAVMVASEVFEACYFMEQVESATSIVRTTGAFIDNILYDIQGALINPLTDEAGNIVAELSTHEIGHITLALAKVREDCNSFIARGPLEEVYNGTARRNMACNYGATFERMKRSKDNVMAMVTEEVNIRLSGTNVRLAVFNKYISRRLDSVSVLPIPRCVIELSKVGSWV